MPAFDINHPQAWKFTRQCFRIGLISKKAALLQEAFIENESNRPWMFDRLKQLPIKSFAIQLDATNVQHVTWAALSYEMGVWGPAPATFDSSSPLWVEFALEETQNGIARLLSAQQGSEHRKESTNSHDDRDQNTNTSAADAGAGEDPPRSQSRGDLNPAVFQDVAQQNAGGFIEQIEQHLGPIPQGDEGDRKPGLERSTTNHSTIIRNRGQLKASDRDHLSDLFDHAESIACSPDALLNAVFDGWDTSMGVNVLGPEVPTIYQTTSDMNRVQVGVFSRNLKRNAPGRASSESHKARMKGQPVYLYGATDHGMPFWEYKDGMGNDVVDNEVVTVTLLEEEIEAAVAKIGTNWRAWAEARVKQHDTEVLVWMVRHRLSLWYCIDGITWGDGVPLYNKVDMPEFVKWELDPWYLT